MTKFLGTPATSGETAAKSPQKTDSEKQQASAPTSGDKHVVIQMEHESPNKNLYMTKEEDEKLQKPLEPTPTPAGPELVLSAATLESDHKTTETPVPAPTEASTAGETKPAEGQEGSPPKEDPKPSEGADGSPSQADGSKPAEGEGSGAEEQSKPSDPSEQPPSDQPADSDTKPAESGESKTEEQAETESKPAESTSDQPAESSKTEEAGAKKKPEKPKKDKPKFTPAPVPTTVGGRGKSKATGKMISGWI